MSTPSHWDRHARAFTSEVFDITRAHRGRTLDRLVRELAPPRGTGLLLDAGCGIGTFTRQYGARFAHVVAMDFSPAILARAMRAKPAMANVTWMCADIVALPALLRPGLADLTVSLNVLTYASKDRNRAILRALRDCTAKGGHAIVVAPSAESEAEAQGLPATAAAVHLQQRLGLKQTFFTRVELARAALRAGWKAADVMPITYPRAYERVGKAGTNSRRDNYDWLAVLTR
ncbi:MAG: class I SAM-dependent methyltransferase [Gemmatimonadetes bacterium]|nr:class I SAM-dependent methyltransferase [Gemmatimonadota bacterium]